MKKFVALLLALSIVMAFAACTGNTNPTTTNKPQGSTPVASTPVASTPVASQPEGDAVMTYDEFAAIEVVEGGEQIAVVVDCYIAAVESWYNGACHIYALCEEGGYYIYGYECTEDEAAALVPGMKIRVSGFKTVWSGEVEIVDATIEVLEGTAPEFTVDDVTALVGTEELAKHMNDLVAFKGMTVVASKDANGNEAAFLYKWDGSGSQGSDLYFNVAIGETVYTFTVNVYMVGTGVDSEVYKAVEALKIGDVIDIEGFLYWYNGAQTHVTAVKTAG